MRNTEEGGTVKDEEKRRMRNTEGWGAVKDEKQ
jgi:hypothetical protein